MKDGASHDMLGSQPVGRHITRMKTTVDFQGHSHNRPFSLHFYSQKKAFFFFFFGHTKCLGLTGTIYMNEKNQKSLYIVTCKRYSLSTTDKTRNKPLYLQQKIQADEEEKRHLRTHWKRLLQEPTEHHHCWRFSKLMQEQRSYS